MQSPFLRAFFGKNGNSVHGGTKLWLLGVVYVTIYTLCAAQCCTLGVHVSGNADADA